VRPSAYRVFPSPNRDNLKFESNHDDVLWPQLTDPNPSRFSCSPYRALLIQPIIARGDLGSLEPVDPFGSPYAHPRLLSIIRKNRGVPGEVMGLLVGNLNWMESGDKIMARLPPGIQSEASKHSVPFVVIY
jgi:hypothetical protein